MAYWGLAMQQMTHGSILAVLVLLCTACGGNGGGNANDVPAPIAAAPSAGTLGDGRLPEITEWARDSQDVPALAVVVVRNGQVVERAAMGRRSISKDVLVTTDDRWHIGSMTKAMTATVAAVLVEEGVITWDSTPIDVWPELGSNIHSGFRNATLRQFLAHTSGMKRDDESGSASDSAAGTVTEKRRAWTEHLLQQAPEFTAGEHHYSNVGYVVAGAMLEARGGASWEILLTTKVFAPLGMVHSGFGAPGTPAALDQPLGHWSRRTGFAAIDPGDSDANIPASVGPAGNVHITLDDYAQFMIAHLAGARGVPGLVSAESFTTLHTPVASDYALGWGTPATMQTLNVAALGHTGSTNRWFSLVWLAPSIDTGLMIVANGGGERALAAIRALDLSIRERVIETP
jgi:CubicO group peptidase (beta-lactamase class C family)